MSRKMQSILALAAASLLLFSLIFSGCGSKGTSAPQAESEAPESTVQEPVEAETESKEEADSVYCAEDQAMLAEYGYITHHETVESDALTWDFDASSGTLHISGTGPMMDFWDDDPAWSEYQDSITNIVLDDGITTVGDFAFYGYMSIESVELPDSIEYIGRYAFEGAYQLSDIPFPASLKEIGGGAFQEVKVHKPLTIPEGVEIIGAGAFHANDFRDTITIPASVYYIAEEAFSNSLHVHDFVVSPDNAYYTAIDGVLYDKAVTVLLEYPIYKETEDFAIPDTVTRIADYSFDLNMFMQTLYIPKSVTEVGSDQFGLLRQLQEYIVEDGSELFKTDGGALLSKDGKILYAYAPLHEAEEYTIPDGVETIEFRAFTEAWNLKKLTVPEGIKTIKVSGLSDLNGTELYLPESFVDTVTEIDSWALVSYEDGGWDLGSGFTYTPNTDNGVTANGSTPSTPMTVHYAGSQEKWEQFAQQYGLYLDATVVICE